MTGSGVLGAVPGRMSFRLIASSDPYRRPPAGPGESTPGAAFLTRSTGSRRAARGCAGFWILAPPAHSAPDHIEAISLWKSGTNDGSLRGDVGYNSQSLDRG